jgi:hypothetical protein
VHRTEGKSESRFSPTKSARSPRPIPNIPVLSPPPSGQLCFLSRPLFDHKFVFGCGEWPTLVLRLFGAIDEAI